MKKIIIAFLVIAATSQNIYSQCKSKIDEITKEKVVSFNTTFREKQLLNTFNLVAKNSDIKLTFSIMYRGTYNSIVPAGTEIAIKLKNNEIIKLTTANAANPSLIADVSGVFTSYPFLFQLTSQDIAKFATVDVEFIRFPDMKSGDLDLKKAGKTLNKGAKCLNEGMSK